MKTTREIAIHEAQLDSETVLSRPTFNSQVDLVWDALAVMVLSPHIREYLIINDPNALTQARNAMGLPPIQR